MVLESWTFISKKMNTDLSFKLHTKINLNIKCKTIKLTGKKKKKIFRSRARQTVLKLFTKGTRSKRKI